MSFRRFVIVVLALVVSACASSGTSTGGESQTASRASGGNSRLIVRAQLEEHRGESAYRVIETLQRRWLQENRRGATLSGRPVSARVVVDGISRGGLNELYRMSSDEIEFIRFLSAADATTAYGTGYLGGAIEVTTRARGR